MTNLSFEWKIQKGNNDKNGFLTFEIIIPCSTKMMAQNFLTNIEINEKKSRLWDESCKSNDKKWIKKHINLLIRLEEENSQLKEKLEWLNA